MKLTKLIDRLQAIDSDYEDIEVYTELCGDYDRDIEIEIKEVNNGIAVVIS